MRRTIHIDDALLGKAMRLAGTATKKATVEAALRLLIQTRSQAGMRKLRGKVKWEGNLEESRRGSTPGDRTAGSVNGEVRVRRPCAAS